MNIQNIVKYKNTYSQLETGFDFGEDPDDHVMQKILVPGF
jgi:hypothetical protein